MLHTAIAWLVDTIFKLGYPGIVVLMAIESSVFPLPSELVMPPAGYLAAQGRMDFVMVVFAGVVGSVLGALANYALAAWLGRLLLHRYARYFLIKETSLDRTEAFFRRHGEISTLLGRLLPVIRHLISLPAGLARMSLARFSLFTAVGAGVWCTILTYIGWFLGRRAEALTQAEVQRYSLHAILILLPVMAVAIAVYVFRQRKR